MKVFSFKTQLNVGALGVQIAKSILRPRYTDIVDYADDYEMQQRGVDLYVPGLGYVEVKTDTYAPERFFFELDVEGKPGAVDRSSADYFCIVYPSYRVMYLIPRPALQKWLRDNLAWIEEQHSEWVKHTTSREHGHAWRATGIIVPHHLLMTDLKVEVIAWQEEDERVPASWKGG